MEVKQSEDGQQRNKKLKRHFFVVVMLVALAFIYIGVLFGSFITDFIVQRLGEVDDAIVFLFDYLSSFGIIIFVFLYCIIFEKDVFRSFMYIRQGGAKGNTFKRFGIGVLMGFLLNSICVLIAFISGDLHFSLNKFSFIYMIIALLCVLVQSGAEELVCRGYLMGALRERYPAWVVILINVIIFVLPHLGNDGISVLPVIQIALIAFVAGLIVYYLDSLWMAIGLHTAWNFTQSFLYGLPNSGKVSKGSVLHLEAASDSIFYDVAFGIEGALTAVLIMVVFAVAVILYIRRIKSKNVTVKD